MNPDDSLILSVAKRIFTAEHPRKSWIAHPNYAQMNVQARYIETARVIVNQVRAHDLIHGSPPDPVAQVPAGAKAVKL